MVDHGIYTVIKPIGWTSFDVVNKLKHMTGEKKIGHAGTLDPMATGVLVIAIGRTFTRQLTELSGLSKTYLADITFGIVTDSYDLDGRVTAMKQPVDLTLEKIEAALESFKGTIEQLPPIYSAIKKNGKKLYEYARKNQAVEITPRTVEIYDLDVVKFVPGEYPTVQIRINVSKGTYVRSIAFDLGQKLGVGAVLSGLVRESVGHYQLSEAITLDRLH